MITRVLSVTSRIFAGLAPSGMRGIRSNLAGWGDVIDPSHTHTPSRITSTVVLRFGHRRQHR